MALDKDLVGFISDKRIEENIRIETLEKHFGEKKYSDFNNLISTLTKIITKLPQNTNLLLKHVCCLRLSMCYYYSNKFDEAGQYVALALKFFKKKRKILFGSLLQSFRACTI